MKFEEALYCLRQGRKVRRKAWPPNHYICKQHNMTIYDLIKISELFESDWEVRELSFKDIISPLFSEKSTVCHTEDYTNPENHFCFRNNVLYKGFGTTKMCVYSFTDEDISAHDWSIIST